MVLKFGYGYDKDGKFTGIIEIPETPIYEKRTFYDEVTKEVVTEEKLCKLHQSIKDGTYEPGENQPVQPYDCPDCVMYSVTYEKVKVPYERPVCVGYEHIVPANCTLEVCPDLIFEPRFIDGKWVKTKDYTPPTEPTKPAKTEVEELREQVKNLMKVVDEILIGGAM